MDFVIDNYIWFLIAGVVLIMALIGYIAEKNDFVKEKKPKEKKAKKEIATETEEIATEESKTAPMAELPVEGMEEQPASAMDWDMPMMETTVSMNDESQISDATVVDAPNAENTAQTEVPSSEPTEEVVDLFDEISVEQPAVNEADTKESSDVVSGQSDTELKEEKNNSTSDQEDIWKF